MSCGVTPERARGGLGSDAVTAGARAAAASTSGALVKPRLRGVPHQYAFFVSLACGVGLILAASGRARAGRGGIYAVARLGAARHERAVPPRHLAPAGAALDAPARPLDDLRADRRHLHAGGAARAEGRAGEHDPDRAVGRRARRRDLQARSGSTRPKWLFAARLRRARLVTAAVFGELPARSAGSASPGIAAGGLLYMIGRGHLRERTARTRGRRCSATTRSSTRS